MIFTDSHYGTSLMRAALRWKGGYNLVISAIQSGPSGLGRRNGIARFISS